MVNDVVHLVCFSMLLSTMHHLKLRPFTALVFYHTVVLLLLTPSCGGTQHKKHTSNILVCFKIKDNNYSLRSNTEEKAARQSWKKRVSAVQVISTLISVIGKQ